MQENETLWLKTKVSSSRTCSTYTFPDLFICAGVCSCLFMFQVALRYQIQRGVSVVPKTAKKERMVENFEVGRMATDIRQDHTRTRIFMLKLRQIKMYP